MFLIDVIKPKVEMKLKTLSTFCATGSAQKKTILFLFALGLLAATKTLFKRNEKRCLKCK